MEYVRLPGSELNPSAICLGTSMLGSAVGREDAFRLLDRFVGEGGNFLDTALVYADWLTGEKSVSEKTIGAWMRERGNRGEVLVATKGAHPDLAMMHISRVTPADIALDIERSLRHLQTDWIDLYWLHRDDPSVPVAELIDVLEEHVRRGNIRAYGCSNWRCGRIGEARQYSARRGYQGFVASQNRWSLAETPPPGDKTMVAMDEREEEYHRETGLPAIPYSSQAGGFFSGKYRPETLQKDAETIRKLRPLCTERNIRRLEKVLAIAAESGRTGTQVALAYLRSQPFPVIPIVGCRTMEQLEDSLGAGDFRLDEGTVQALREL
jgi:aryl-alcohol dehydrogenase-like predicted oxidoreductase